MNPVLVPTPFTSNAHLSGQPHSAHHSCLALSSAVAADLAERHQPGPRRLPKGWSQRLPGSPACSKCPAQHCRQHAGPRRPECSTSAPGAERVAARAAGPHRPNGRRPQQPARTGAGVCLGRTLDSVRPCAFWQRQLQHHPGNLPRWQAGHCGRVKADTRVASQHRATPFGVAPLYTTRSRRRRTGCCGVGKPLLRNHSAFWPDCFACHLDPCQPCWPSPPQRARVIGSGRRKRRRRARCMRSGARVAAASAGMAESHAPACGPDWDRNIAQALGLAVGPPALERLCEVREQHVSASLTHPDRVRCHRMAGFGRQRGLST